MSHVVLILPDGRKMLSRSSSNSLVLNEGPIYVDARRSISSPFLVEAAALQLNSKQATVDIIICTLENRVEIMMFPNKTLRILPWGAHRSHVDLAKSLVGNFCVPEQVIVEGCCKACESFRQKHMKAFALEVDSESNSFTTLITRTQCLNACATTVKVLTEEIHARKDLTVALWEGVCIPGLKEELSLKGCQIIPLDSTEILDGLHMLVIEKKQG